MEFVNKILFLLSDGMLVPVMVLLILLFIKALVMVGGFFGLAVQRVKTRPAEKNYIERVRSMESPEGESESLPAKDTPFAFFLSKLLRDHKGGHLSEKILAEAQLRFEKECDGLKIIMRMGPMLGLMGTIIPMGPALTGLATGDIGMMAQNMQIAFATTVIGLFCGVVGFILQTIQKRWYAEDLVGLTHVFEVLCEKN